MIEKVRFIKEIELEKLLTLYQYLNSDDPLLEINYHLKKLWAEILKDPNLYYFVIEEDGELISTCNLAIIKNLTRSARPYGIIENVVTHPDYRKKGFGTAVLQKAIEIARSRNCYKVMLSTSRKEESTLRFYEKTGFDKNEKTTFVVRI